MRLRPLAAACAFYGLMLALTVAALRLFGGLAQIGDYLVEADQPLQWATDGHLFALYGGDFTPLMWPLALAVRVPFLWIGDLLGITAETIYGAAAGSRFDDAAQTRYALGALGMVSLAGTAFGLTVASVRSELSARPRWILAALAGALVALNPISLLGVAYGHPEEVFMAGFMAAGLLLIASGRLGWGAVMIGLAVATKQPALLIVPAAFFMVPTGKRLRTAAIGAATTVTVSLPWTLGSLGAFLGVNGSVLPTDPVAQSVSGISIWRFTGGLTEGLTYRSHLIVGLAALGATLWVASRHRWTIPPRQGLALAAAVMALRCLLDSYNISYYAAPMVACLIALVIASGLSWRASALAVIAVLGFALLLAQLTAFSDLKLFLIRHIGYGFPGPAFVFLLMLVVSGALWWALRRGGGEDPGGGAMSIHRQLFYVAVAPLVVLLVLTPVGRQFPFEPRVPAPPGMTPVRVESLANLPEQVWWLGPAPMSGQVISGAAVPPHYAKDKSKRAVVQYRSHGGPKVRVASVYTGTPEEEGRALERDLAECGKGTCPLSSKLLPTRAGEGILSGPVDDWTYRVIAPDGALVIVYGTNAGDPEVTLGELRPVSR